MMALVMTKRAMPLFLAVLWSAGWQKAQQRVLLLHGDADTVVANLERELARVGLALDGIDVHEKLHQRLAPLDVAAVLDGVVHQVDAALAQAEKVAYEARVEVLGLADEYHQLHASAGRLLRDVGHLLDELPDRPHVLGQLDARARPAALVLGALELGEVQNLVDQFGALRRVPGRRTVGEVRESPDSIANVLNPMMEFSGVRSSCVMLKKNARCVGHVHGERARRCRAPR